MNDLLLGYYGDDFTGSTDVMEALGLAGVPAVLFLHPPTPEEMARFPGRRAIGIAGVSRSLPTAGMEDELRPAFEALSRLACPLVHYKTCSTFDSSPTVGSIGRAMELGREVFGSPWIPLVVGAPRLKRYVAFANLFATVDGETYRIDRHPTMSRHPVTPMREGDLRLHLAEQCDLAVRSFDTRALGLEREERQAMLERLLAGGADAVLFDTLQEQDLARIGRLIWENRTGGQTFLAGSSGMEYALCAWWREAGLIAPPTTWTSPGEREQIVVISGSASPVTAAQIEHARAIGYCDLRLDAPALVDPETSDKIADGAVKAAVAAIHDGRSPLLYTAVGPDDPAIARTRERSAAHGDNARNLGQQQGRILRRILEATNLRRVCVAGGDTAGYVSRELSIRALEMIIPATPGSPLCRTHASEERFDGLEICLKGGQVGKPDFFETFRRGEPEDGAVGVLKADAH